MLSSLRRSVPFCPFPQPDPLSASAQGPVGPTGPLLNFSDGETPTGVIDGVNTTFTLAHAPNPASTLILTNQGMTQWQNALGDYTLSGATITFATAPTLGPMLAFYRF